MFTELQQKIVARLDSAREADAGTEPAGRLVPVDVRPYGGEALRPKRLINSVPVCFVEFDVGAMEVEDYAGQIAGGEISLDVLCCTRNQSGGEAEYSDGLALVTWTFEQLVGMEIDLEGVGTAYWTTMSVGRMMSGKDLWIAKVSPDLKLRRH